MVGDGDGDVALGGHVGGTCTPITMLGSRDLDTTQRAISPQPRSYSSTRCRARPCRLNILEAAGLRFQADARPLTLLWYPRGSEFLERIAAMLTKVLFCR